MKSENSEHAPAVDFTQFKTTQGQVNSKEIKAVLLNDGHWYFVIPGSFHLYMTQEKIPFVQFDGDKIEQAESNTAQRIEVFAPTVAGWAYDIPEDEVGHMTFLRTNRDRF